MSTKTQLVTADELFAMSKDGLRYELVKGELRKMSPAGTEHGAVVFNLTLLLGQHLRVSKLGQGFGAETGFKIFSNPDTVRAPDIAFVRRERIPETGIPKNFWDIAPDLAVEVLSPSDTVNEVDEKVEDWLAAGVRVVWVVNPRTRAVTLHLSPHEVVVLHEQDELDGGEVVPGFRCRVAEIFG